MPQGPPEPDPKTVIEQQKLELDSRKIDLQERQVAMNEQLNQEKMTQFRADSIKSLATAENEAIAGGDTAQVNELMQIVEQHEQTLEKMVEKLYGQGVNGQMAE
jgi:Na+-transporting NADH:ubiquinone oxidoreductase subunit NqrC